MGTLYQINYSPWSEKARWALQHHKIVYRSVEALPMLGEPIIRVRLKRWSGKITYPLFVTDQDRVLPDSLVIARWADVTGAGSTLFPPSHLDEVLQWNTLAERALSAGRVLTTLAVSENPKALTESIPAVIPRQVGPVSLGPMLRQLGTLGAQYLARKYNFTSTDVEQCEATVRGALEQLREALPLNDSIEPPYLCGGAVSWADIAMAVALQFVSPVSQRYIVLGSESRTCWTRDSLADEYADLLAWRDALYDTHR